MSFAVHEVLPESLLRWIVEKMCDKWVDRL